MSRGGKVSHGFAHLLDVSDWISWERAVENIRNAVNAEDAYLSADPKLARQERNRFGLR